MGVSFVQDAASLSHTVAYIVQAMTRTLFCRCVQSHGLAQPRIDIESIFRFRPVTLSEAYVATIIYHAILSPWKINHVALLSSGVIRVGLHLCC
eukprot:COSAG02_NODE_16038_length_1119_cov_0.851961_1_plen_94_part_00